MKKNQETPILKDLARILLKESKCVDSDKIKDVSFSMDTLQS